MSKLHEVLAAEKTRVAAWNKLLAETIHKLKNPNDFFVGYSKALSMIEDTPSNKALEAQAAEEKQVTTTVPETLAYALGVFGQSEDLQFQKNATNRIAIADVMYGGKPLLVGMPVDQLLGLEARLVKVRELFETMPTLAGSIRWERVEGSPPYVWTVAEQSVNTKTEKIMVPIVLAQATDKHPAQVKEATKDVVVGTVRSTLRSGACTTNQKAAALTLIDELMVEIKRARMRANETEVVAGSVSGPLVSLLMSPFLKE